MREARGGLGREKASPPVPVFHHPASVTLFSCCLFATSLLSESMALDFQTNGYVTYYLINYRAVRLLVPDFDSFRISLQRRRSWGFVTRSFPMRRITWRATRTPAWEPRAGYADRWKSNQMFQGTALFFSNYDSSHLSPFLKGLTFYASSISYSAWLDSFTFFYLFFHFLHTFLLHYTKEVKSIFRWWTRSLAI